MQTKPINELTSTFTSEEIQHALYRVNADQDLKYILHWRSRFSQAGGVVGPTKRACAARIVAQWNLLIDIDHWIELVKADVGEPGPALPRGDNA